MTDTGFSRADKATQLVAFLSGDPIARKRFPEMYHKGILKQAKFLMSLRGNDLDADLVEDIVQIFWLSLLEAPPDVFRTNGGNTDGFIKNRLLTAIRDVRATYTPPGQPTRLPKKDSEAAKKRRTAAVSLDAPHPEAENGGTLADVHKDPQDKIAETINRISATQTLTFMQSTTPAGVSQALTLISKGDLPFSKAAQAVNLHHTSLRRILDAWLRTYSDYFC